MFEDMFVVPMGVDDGLEPSSSVCPRLDIFVLRCVRDMLHEARSKAHIGEDGVDRGVTVLGADFLCSCT